MAEDSHDRGTFKHPEDGQTHRHPSSLESPHHIGIDGKPVYSKAQLDGMRMANEMTAAASPMPEIDHLFLSYESPAARQADAEAKAAAEAEAAAAAASAAPDTSVSEG